jgi:hypothetical protein
LRLFVVPVHLSALENTSSDTKQVFPFSKGITVLIFNFQNSKYQNYRKRPFLTGDFLKINCTDIITMLMYDDNLMSIFMLTKKKKMLSDISGSQSGENEDDTFLGKHH